MAALTPLVPSEVLCSRVKRERPAEVDLLSTLSSRIQVAKE